MSIKMMTKKGDHDFVIENYPGAHGPLYMKETFKGAVIDTGERNYRDDSDFYATVYDKGADTVRNIEYATTRGWSYPNSAVIDATPEVLRKAHAARFRANLKAIRRKEIEDAKEPVFGDKVRVFKGRKVKPGIEGKVIWLGEGNYGKRAGIALDDEMETRHRKDGTPYEVHANVAWLAAENLEVIDPESKVPSDSAIRRRAYAAGRDRIFSGIRMIYAPKSLLKKLR